MKFSDCKNEQQFKMKYIKSTLKPQYSRVFCIETGETIKGFPDVMCLEKGKAYFFEFKYSNAYGKIKFQPSQPAFYKANNSYMDVVIVAYNKKTDSVITFSANCLADKNSPYCMNEKAEVML